MERDRFLTLSFSKESNISFDSAKARDPERTHLQLEPVSRRTHRTPTQPNPTRATQERRLSNDRHAPFGRTV